MKLLFAVFVTSLLSLTVYAGDWYISQLPNQPSLRGSAVYQNTIWVTGTNNSVYLSKNLGKTWHNISVQDPLMTDFRDIQVFDENTAIVMGAGTGTQSRLYLTKNQGKTWEVLFENPDRTGFFDSIDFWDRDNGLLLGDPVSGYFVVMRTQDGGKSWQRTKQEDLPTLFDEEAAFAASGNTLVTGNHGQAWFTTGGKQASVYYSADFGHSWQRYQVPLHYQGETAGGYGLGLGSQGRVFVVGGDYQHRAQFYPNIALYKDGQWKSPKMNKQGLRTALSCYQSLCIATGKLFTDISFDHGNTWKVELIDGKHQGFYTLAQDQGVFVGAGDKGRVGVMQSIKAKP